MAEPNWESGTVWTGDCLDVMRGMNSESVDLMYLDPPFNSNTDYAAPIGSAAAGAAFKDTWSLSDIDVEWLNLISLKEPAVHRVLLAAMTNSDKSYLVYMAARLLEMPRLLKPTGSIYVHCDPTMSHYLKLLMDAIWDRNNFRNEMIWCYSWPRNTRRYYGRMHDVLLFYSNGDGWTFNPDEIRQPYSTQSAGRDEYAANESAFGEAVGPRRSRQTAAGLDRDSACETEFQGASRLSDAETTRAVRASHPSQLERG